MSSRESQKRLSDIDCEEVLKVLCGFIRTEVRKTGFTRVVVGVSGGIDSSLSAALGARALGPENVLGVLMPYETSSPESASDGRLLAKTVGIRTREVDITPMCRPFFELDPEMDSLRRGNVMARMRMIVLYDLSSAEKALVLGTSNKTEALLGYTTLWGDNASALNPLGDLYKYQVRELARHIGVPARIIDKKPSADLWAGQTDEEELGFTYDEADMVLELLIDLRLTPEQVIARGFEESLVRGILRKVQSTQFKRQLPLIAKISDRTINRDFRFPRDWGM